MEHRTSDARAGDSGSRVVEQPTASCSAAVQAWQQRKLTLSFSGGGFLLPYHLGVYQSLAAMGIVNSSTPMAGSSAGSLVVGAIKSGLSLQQQMDSVLETAHACRQHGVTGRLRRVLKAQLLKTLPEDAAARCSDGSCWVSVTQVFPRPANKLYGGFSSRQQLIKALLASCHLPRLSDGGLFTSYKALHKRVFDGGFSNLCPVPPILPHHSTQHVHHDSSSAAISTSTAAGVGPGSSNNSGSNSGAETCQHVASITAAARARHAPTADTTASSTEAHPTAPAAALVLQRSDSTKGITTRLTRTKSRPHKHSGSTYSRSLSAPAAPAGSRMPLGLQHSDRSSSAVGHSGGNAGHKGVRLNAWHSVLLPHRHRRQQQQQQVTDVEALLAAGCEVSGCQGAYLSAEGWCVVRVCLLPARDMHQMPAMFRAPSAEEVSIALDKFQDWPHDLDATTNLALYPQDDDFLWDLFKRGQQDGASWAAQQGFPADVQQRLPQQAEVVEELRVQRSAAAGHQQEQQGPQQGGDAQKVQQQQQQEAAVLAAAAGMQEVQQAVIEQE